MAAVSIALVHGVEGFQASDFTVGTAAPTATKDFELRFNETDMNGNAISRRDVLLALEAFERTLVENDITLGAIIPE